MKTIRKTLYTLLACAVGSALLAAPAQALPSIAQVQERQALPVQMLPPDESSPFMMAASDCYAVGQQYAASVGGQLARATPQDQGGQVVCVIVVLMPAKDGQRPRRQEVVLPLN